MWYTSSTTGMLDGDITGITEMCKGVFKKKEIPFASVFSIREKE